MPRSTRTPDRFVLAAVQVPALLVLAVPVVGLVLALTDVRGLPAGSLRDLLPLGGRPWGLLLRSVAFSAAVALLTTLAGTWTAWGLLGMRRGVALLTLVLPPLLIVPLSIHGLNWATAILELNAALLRHRVPLQLTGWGAATVAEVLAFLPLAIGTAWAGFAALDRRLLEAAMTCRNPRAVAWRITLPMAGKVLTAGAGLIFLLGLSDFSVPSLFAVQVYAMEIFATYSASSHPAGAVLTAMPLMLLISLAMVGLLRTGGGARPALHARASGPWPCRTGGGHAFGAVTALLLLLGLPLAALVAGTGSGTMLWQAVANARGELGVSLRVAALTALAATLLGAGVARGLLRGPLSALWWTLACLWFAMPAPLVAIGVLQIANRAGAGLEPWLPVWVCLIRFLPVAAFIGYAVMLRTDHVLLEAARLYQSNRLHGALRVVLPLAWRGLAMAALACFALAFGELGASLLVAPPGQSTLIIRLYNLLHYGASHEVAALGLGLSLPALGAGLALTCLLRRPYNRL